MDHLIENGDQKSGDGKNSAQDALINRISSDLVLSRTNLLDDTLAPDSALARYGMVTLKGLGHVPQGILHAGEDALSHPLRTAGIVGTSAAMGVVLKTVLPESGAAGKIAGLAIGAYFTCEAAQPIMQSYRLAGQARTMKDLDLAATTLGDAAGAFAVNTAIAGVGYNLGAAGAQRILARPEFAGFNSAKQVAWDKFGESVGRMTGLIEPKVIEPTTVKSAVESGLPEKFEWGNSTIESFDARNFRHVPVRQLAQQIANYDGATLHLSDRITAPEMLMNQKGDVFLSIPRNAGPEAMSESIAAASYAKLIESDPILSRAAKNSVQSAFDGAQAYVRGDNARFNNFSHALADRYGFVSAQDRVYLNRILTSPDAAESPWNPAVGPATEALADSGIPIRSSTRGAIQNPAIEAMHPGNRKQAVFAALSLTYDQAKQLYGNESPQTFNLSHGEMARALSPEQVLNAVEMYRVSGATDLSSPFAPKIMEAAASLSDTTGRGFHSSYQALTTAAPYVARDLGMLPSTEIRSINSLSQLLDAIVPPEGKTRADAMEAIFSRTGAALQNTEAHMMATVLAHH